MNVPPPFPRKLVFRSPAAAVRLRAASRWLAERGRASEIIVVGASEDAAADLVRRSTLSEGAFFGWHRFTLGRLAGTLAARALGALGRTPIGPLPLEAVCARVVHDLGLEGLGRFAAIADRPGLPRALARTLGDVRIAGAISATLEEPDLAKILAAYERELVRSGLVDRAGVFALAAEMAADLDQRHELLGKPILLLDVPLVGARDRDLVRALAARCNDVLLTVPSGDEVTDRLAREAMGGDAIDGGTSGGTLGRLQSGLFSATAAPGAAGDEVVVLSAPGESRECVEIARLVQKEAEGGVPFDEMAVLLRAPAQYRAHLAEALRRAGIPAYFARGTVRPDPVGRAFLALLACASDGLSARRFAEYLSLGEAAEPDAAGGPPVAPDAADRWVPADEELRSAAIGRAAGPPVEEEARDEAPPREAAGGGPFLWEQLLIDAAVIHGMDRWKARLRGHARKLELDGLEIKDAENPMAARIQRDRTALDGLEKFGLPLLADLAALPASASWGTWIDMLSRLASRSLRSPERVQAVLEELTPMAAVGPVDLGEVRVVLERRLTELVAFPSDRRLGRLFIGEVGEARGLAFEVVFVPGLAERLFPQKVTEDPILLDRERERLADFLPTNADRSQAERLALRIAAGAAKKRLVISYPRIDIEQSRPRTPSFYGLEVLRAAEGRLPGFDELARRAEAIGAARLGWPAPAEPLLAIDAAEHDLAVLESVLKLPEKEAVGRAHYLLSANDHLARALRFRARRWNVRAFTPADGLVNPGPEGRAALDAHALSARSYSPTALQHYAACPYRFVLSALHKLAPRDEPVPLDELDPLQRGSLVHEVQFKFYGALREAGYFPMSAENLPALRDRLDEAIASVAKEFKEELAPAIDRVWEDGIASIRADLRELLRRSAEDPRWTPAHFELSFGLAERRDRDPQSVEKAVALDCGIALRGSIDLIERNAKGALRATDYKTGKVRATDATVIGGGETLQPVLYALVLEKVFPGERVDAGRLYYCTSVGEFTEVNIPLDDAAREAASAVASTVGRALTDGFFPAAPVKRGCEYCDYAIVCGPYEEVRTARKKQDALAGLVALRSRP